MTGTTGLGCDLGYCDITTQSHVVCAFPNLCFLQWTDGPHLESCRELRLEIPSVSRKEVGGAAELRHIVWSQHGWQAAQF